MKTAEDQFNDFINCLDKWFGPNYRLDKIFLYPQKFSPIPNKIVTVIGVPLSPFVTRHLQIFAPLSVVEELIEENFAPFQKIVESTLKNNDRYGIHRIEYKL